MLSDSLRSGFATLWQAHTYARDAGQDQWAFAVESEELRAQGLTANDLRWLVAKGLVFHATELTAFGDSRRSFERTAGIQFADRTCFVLTPSGAEYAQQLVGTASPPGWRSSLREHANLLSLARGRRSVHPLVKPDFDAARRELWVGETVVKRFRVPAPNQELVLSVFQEEGWPPSIDDPLPVVAEIDPKRRLHNAINSLNRNQQVRLLRFFGTGNGQAFSWELIRA